MAVTREEPAPHWAPANYRPATEAERVAAYASPDIHLAVLVSILHHNPGITRIELATRFYTTIMRHNAGGWGRQWVLTLPQVNNLIQADFEMAWRAISSETVAAYGV